MARIVPPVYVPPAQPGAMRYGLFTAANGPLPMEPHMRIGGVQYEPESCGVGRLYTAACPAGGQADKGLDAPAGESTHPFDAEPFVVYASVVCPPVGHDAAEHTRRAVARLLGAEQTQVERAVWDGGGVGAAPNLADNTTTTLVPTVIGFNAVIAELEAEFYALHGYMGTIHVNTAAYGAAAYGDMIVGTVASGRLTTPKGSVWSFGDGYTVNGPAGAVPAAGNVWAYITPAVTLWRSEDIGTPDPNQTMNRPANQMYAVAEREWAAGWACDTIIAVEVPIEAPRVVTAP